VFDDTISHGLSGWPQNTIQASIFEMFKGVNLEAAISTIIARTLSIDILYVHLSLVPVLWGIFVPVALYLITKGIGGSEEAAVLSSLLISAFQYPIYFGAISVPNSLGFIFFLYSLYFMLRHLTSEDSNATYWMLAFSLFSFLSHYLTGIMSFSLLVLTLAFKAYERESKSSPKNARIFLIIAFIFSMSFLPLSFIYLRLLNPSTYAVFTLDKINGMPPKEIISLFLFGEPTDSLDIKTTFLITIGPLLAFVWMVYQLYRFKTNPASKFRTRIHFLFAAFLILIIDYGILKLFMEGLIINEERLWVFRDFIAVPFVALAVYAVVLSFETVLKAKSHRIRTIANLKTLSKSNAFHVLSALLTLNVLIPALLGGWITLSVGTAYPQVAPLQTTDYELEAVRYIEENTHEKYVVIGDVWTIFAGEMIVGINNPGAYYFDEFNKTGHDLFVNMTRNPSPKWMLLAMNYTDTTVAYFTVTEPRLGTEEFNDVISSTLKNEQLTLAGVFGGRKLYVFSYRNG
jgi:hypothetical protein